MIKQLMVIYKIIKLKYQNNGKYLSYYVVINE